MKITNKQFTDDYLSSSSPREVLALLEVIRRLISRHQLVSFMRLPESAELADLQALIRVIGAHKKLTINDINGLIRQMKIKGGKDAQSLVLTANDSSLAASLQKAVHADGQIDMRQTAEVGIMLQGEDSIYKRTLKTDLNKLLA